MAQMAKCLPTMRETQVRSLGWEYPLEKEMATHSSILAWKIAWTEEPGGLQSMGSQRVGHKKSLSDFTLTFTHVERETSSVSSSPKDTSLCGFVHSISLGFRGGSDGKASACNAGDPGSIPG